MQLHLKQLLALQMMGVELGLSFAPRDHFSCAFAVDDLRAFRGEGRGLITYAIDVIALHNDERIRDDVGGAWIDDVPLTSAIFPSGVAWSEGWRRLRDKEGDQTKTLHEREIPRLRSE